MEIFVTTLNPEIVIALQPECHLCSACKEQDIAYRWQLSPSLTRPGEGENAVQIANMSSMAARNNNFQASLIIDHPAPLIVILSMTRHVIQLESKSHMSPQYVDGSITKV